MSDEILRRHLLAAHPGAQYPWFARCGYIDVMSDDQLEALHAVLVAQGEDCRVVLDERRPNWAERLRRAEMGAA